MRKNLFLIVSLIVPASYFAQETKIDTVYIFDKQIDKAKSFHKIKNLSLSDIEKNSDNLSDLLRFQTPIYIKENGRGAVSSPAFRGTSAQQTAFVWNGININSTFLGQGDVNNIPLFGYDNIGIKSGGGSVVYGSGAIGGSVHLNNNLDFNKGAHAALFSEIASFGTYNNFLRASFSNEKISVKASANYAISQNDYKVDNINYTNLNGKYYNTTFNLGISYKINNKQKISWQTQSYDSSQNYPIYEITEVKSKYETQSFRSLISWDFDDNKISNSLKAAYTEDNFAYFSPIDQPKYSSGIAKNYIFKDDFNYFISPKINVNIISEFQVNKGEGYNTGIGNESRNVGSFAGLLRYFANKNLRFEGGVKKDFVEDVKSPILYSFSGKWSPLKWYNVSFNFSKNFRYPSFNDIYYQPGGNKDLKPETSLQGDINNEFTFGNLKLNITPYYMDIKDLISWLPTSMGYWQAYNVKKAKSYGLETEVSYKQNIGNHSILAKVGYYYTKSVNKETNLQQAYVPLHRETFGLDYQYKMVKIYAQAIINGLTYTTTNEDKNTAIQSYFVMNTGVSATFKKNYTLGFKVNNITNTFYKTVAFYPLPKRNYSLYISINI